MTSGQRAKDLAVTIFSQSVSEEVLESCIYETLRNERAVALRDVASILKCALSITDGHVSIPKVVALLHRMADNGE